MVVRLSYLFHQTPKILDVIESAFTHIRQKISKTFRQKNTPDNRGIFLNTRLENFSSLMQTDAQKYLFSQEPLLLKVSF